MTLRLTTDQAHALRRRAIAEKTSMQVVVQRALDQYLRAHEHEVPLRLLIDQEVGRFAPAIERLAQWRD